ncbi:MAG: fatty acid desaturase [Acidimicrobiia bacterium]|nr:fatty acid desaturase [Acidimicrobiia bacterium]MBP8179741.1 fatty acid desaturase [Acidimicrobiia bacterium]
MTQSQPSAVKVSSQQVRSEASSVAEAAVAARLTSRRSSSARSVKPVIKPPRELRGAPDLAVWVNPTMWLFVAFVALMAGSIGGYLAGVLSAPFAVLFGVIGRYIGFTVMHESSHRVAHKNARLNDGLAWLPAVSLTLSPHTFRTCHAQHHSHTNDPHVDPDYEVGRQPAVLRIFWLISPLWSYRGRYYRMGWAKTRRHLWFQISIDVALVVGLIWAFAAGHGHSVFLLGILPLFISVAFLTFAFDLLPHKPYDSTERFLDTRALPSRALNIALLGQNYHLIHHAWNTIPWYRYQKVYEVVRPELKAIGARVDWGD